MNKDLSHAINVARACLDNGDPVEAESALEMALNITEITEDEARTARKALAEVSCGDCEIAECLLDDLMHYKPFPENILDSQEDPHHLKKCEASARVMFGLLEAVVNDYQDTGCEDCGTISAGTHDKIAALVRKIRGEVVAP